MSDAGRASPKRKNRKKWKKRRGGFIDRIGYKRLHESERRRRDNTKKKGLLLYMRGLGLVNKKITELFAEAYNWDPFPTEVLDMLQKRLRYCKDITLSECSRSPTGRLLYRGKFYVPSHGPLRLYLIQTHHEVPAAGYPGRSKTLELLAKSYYWPKFGKMWKGL